jgi:hypothetical protein
MITIEDRIQRLREAVKQMQSLPPEELARRERSMRIDCTAYLTRLFQGEEKAFDKYCLIRYVG